MVILMSNEIYEEVEQYKQEYNKSDWIIVETVLANKYLAYVREKQFGIICTNNDTQILDGLNLTNMIMKKLLILTNIVGVQPMRGPVSQCFHMDKYSKCGNISLLSTVIEAKTRKLQAGFSIEKLQDCISINKKLSELFFDIVVSSVFQEVITEILSLLKNAASRTTWVDSEGISSSDIIKRIKLESDYIAVKTGSKKGNYVILSQTNFKLVFPDIDLKQDSIYDSGQLIENDGVNIKVYVSEFMENDVLVGLADGMTDVGFLYCPYVVVDEKIVMHPITLEPLVVMNTRYGISCIEERAARYFSVFGMGKIIIEEKKDKLFNTTDEFKLM